MNTAHVVAWLTCLVLAFLACVLGVFNMGGRIALERQVLRLSASVEAMGEPAESTSRAELNHVRGELGRIGAEMHSLAEEVPSETPANLREKLGGLEEQVKALERRLE
jgi:hypothetical protein